MACGVAWRTLRGKCRGPVAMRYGSQQRKRKERYKSCRAGNALAIYSCIMCNIMRVGRSGQRWPCRRLPCASTQPRSIKRLAKSSSHLRRACARVISKCVRASLTLSGRKLLFVAAHHRKRVAAAQRRYRRSLERAASAEMSASKYQNKRA